VHYHGPVERFRFGAVIPFPLDGPFFTDANFCFSSSINSSIRVLMPLSTPYGEFPIFPFLPKCPVLPVQNCTLLSSHATRLRHNQHGSFRGWIKVLETEGFFNRHCE
jgi:hypothetical protein